MVNSNKNYYLSSFFWSTLSKILNAILGFISVPLLLGYYGKTDYGILSIATACNGYMHLLDLGMNVGAIKFFSQWKTENRIDLLQKVAHTNITFYIIIALINSVGLISLGIWGEHLFSITHEQFQQLKTCLFILSIFSIFSWVTTAFNQLLIADKQISYTMQMQCIQIFLKTLLVFLVLWCDLSLSIYFFFLTFSIALLIVPYSIKCLKDKLIDNLSLGYYWKDFKIVFTFSLSIFALSLFQTTATQSRPIILSIFSTNGANIVAEYRILEVIPIFIIMIGGTLSSIFLPKTSEMVAQNNEIEIQNFAYKWTTLTSILANILCFPFIYSSKEVIAAYVGNEYNNLSIWLILWCITVLIQIHTTPGNSLVLAYGKTKVLVITSAISCTISIIINASLCRKYGVGSAVIGYFIYVSIVIGLYYLIYYKKLIHLNRKKMILCFLKPTILSVFILFAISFIHIEQINLISDNERLNMIAICILKTCIWLIPYLIFLHIFKLVNIKTILQRNNF